MKKPVALFAARSSPPPRSSPRPRSPPSRPPSQGPPALRRRQAAPRPAIVKSTLPNGLTVWVVKRAGFPKVSIALAVRGGTAADPAGLEASPTSSPPR